ncbi:MAG: hypothetical protein ABIN04_09135 [Ginsengibacter sp.]
MKQTPKENQYFKLNVQRLLRRIVLIFFICVLIRQEYQINQLKSELIREQNSIKRLKNNVNDLDSKNSDLENRLDDLESKVDDLESAPYY